MTEIDKLLKNVKKTFIENGLETPEDYLKAELLRGNFTQNGMRVEKIQKKDGCFDVYIVPEENGLIKRIIYSCNNPIGDDE